MDEALRNVRAAVRKWRRAVDRERTERDAMHDVIADALDAGARPVDLVPETPYSREHVRRAAAESRARRRSE